MSATMSSKPIPSSASAHGLSRRRAAAAAALGVAAWLAAALIIHFAMPILLAGGWGKAGLYLAAALAIWLGLRAARRAPDLVQVISIATGAAAFCDVAAMTWAPRLYGVGPAAVLAGAVYVLWGVGCALVMSFRIVALAIPLSMQKALV